MASKFILNKQGFTLAEVLITLGIIGVIAGMTIPVLMQNIQDRQFKEAAKSAYSKASQALQLMKNDAGGSLSAYYGDITNSNAFYSDFKSHFKIAEEYTTRVVPLTGTSDIYSSLTGDAAGTWHFTSQFVTTDGMFWGLYDNGTMILIDVDVNGYQKKPNAFGKDTFEFQLVNDNLLPQGALGTYNETFASTYCSRTYHNALQGYTCMFYVMQGKDY